VNNLTDWITDLNRRHCTINIRDHVAHVEGPAANWNDHHQAGRYAHALQTAANGTHPEWWNHIIGRPTRQLHLNDIPTATNDPDAFACTRCGQPAPHLNHDLTPWCTPCR
jgi:hypothetical protein